MSTISTITLLNIAGVSNFAALREKTVRLGYTEVIRPSTSCAPSITAKHNLLPVRFCVFCKV
jgi:hypothetical protein